MSPLEQWMGGYVFIVAITLTSGPTPQVVSSAVHMSAQANKERKKRKRGERKKRKKKGT